jgi:hypothetical protein
MSLKALLDSLEGLTDEVKPLYKPIGEGEFKGKFVLDVEAANGFTLENVEGLKNAFTATKTELESARAAVEGFKGLNANAVRNQLKELDRLKKIDPETEAGRLAQEQINSKVEELTSKHERETKKLSDRNDFLAKEVDRLLLEAEARASILKHKGVPELLLEKVLKYGRVKEVNGHFETQIVNASGDQDFSIRDGKAVPSTFEDVVAKLKADAVYGRAFEASGRTGSGADNVNNGGGLAGKNPFAKATFNLTRQMELLANDPSLAAALKAAAQTE